MDALRGQFGGTDTAPRFVSPDWQAGLEEHVLAPLGRTSWRYFAWIGFLFLIIIWALVVYVHQLSSGLIVTGMRDRISWGLYIISFVFFIGISHAGTLLSAILRVVKARWQLPVTRMAEFITVVALMVGAIFPLIDLGRPDRVLFLIAYGRWQSPLVWDFLAISTYLTGSVLYLYLPLIPDFALCRDRLGPTAAAWKRAFFTAAAAGWTGTPAQRRGLDRAMTIMMIVIIPVAISVHTVVSWIFAMTLRQPFNSTVFGPYFVAGAIFSGVASIILLMAVLRRLLHLEAFIGRTQFLALGYFLAGMALIMVYFNLQEYVVTGYKMETGAPFHFNDLLNGYLAPFFWFYIIGGLAVPILIIACPWTRTIKGIVIAAAFVVVAMWIERYLIVVGGFRVPLLSYEARSYAPTLTEWSIFAGACAFFALIISVFAKVFPMVSIWEVVEHRGPEPEFAELAQLSMVASTGEGLRPEAPSSSGEGGRS
jgi:Ni/Fe-hydrogenase subunit HybB-like protein